MNSLSFILATIFLALVTYVHAQSCGDHICPSENQCCVDANLGPTCYDPLSYSCVNGDTLCGKGLGACGSVCYDEINYFCCDGTIKQNGQSCTSSGTPCPSPNDESLVCNVGQTCHEASEVSVCCNAGESLCSAGAEIAGGCFNNATQTCCSSPSTSTFLVCALGDTCSFYPQPSCIAPPAATPCPSPNDENLVCSAGETCHSASEVSVCCPAGQQLCSAGTLIAGGCYNSTTEICCSYASTNQFLVCDIGFRCQFFPFQECVNSA